MSAWAVSLESGPRETGCKKIIDSTFLMTEIWPFVTLNSWGWGSLSKIFYQAQGQKDTGENDGFLPNYKLKLVDTCEY